MSRRTTSLQTPNLFQIQIADASMEIERREGQLVQLVTDARAAGVPWSVIGTALGVSKQAAHERYRHLV